jgi:hypothetical protein
VWDEIIVHVVNVLPNGHLLDIGGSRTKEQLLQNMHEEHGVQIKEVSFGPIGVDDVRSAIRRKMIDPASLHPDVRKVARRLVAAHGIEIARGERK